MFAGICVYLELTHPASQEENYSCLEGEFARTDDGFRFVGTSVFLSFDKTITEKLCFSICKSAEVRLHSTCLSYVFTYGRTCSLIGICAQIYIYIVFIISYIYMCV